MSLVRLRTNRGQDACSTRSLSWELGVVFHYRSVQYYPVRLGRCRVPGSGGVLPRTY